MTVSVNSKRKISRTVTAAPFLHWAPAESTPCVRHWEDVVLRLNGLESFVRELDKGKCSQDALAAAIREATRPIEQAVKAIYEESYNLCTTRNETTSTRTQQLGRFRVPELQSPIRRPAGAYCGAPLDSAIPAF